MGIYLNDDGNDTLEQLKSERSLSGRPLPEEQKTQRLILPTEQTKEQKEESEKYNYSKLDYKGLTAKQVQEAIDNYRANLPKDEEIIDEENAFYC